MRIHAVPWIVLLAVPLIAAAQGPAKIKVLMLSGQNNHNWRLTTPNLRAILEESNRFDCRVVEELRGLGPETFSDYQIVMSDFNGGRVGERFEQALREYVAAGKGLVIVHAANNAFNGWDEFDRMIGAAWRAGTYHPAFGNYTVNVINLEHPITAGMKPAFETTDEMYCNMRRHPEAKMTILAQSLAPSGAVKDQPQPMALVTEYGKGRVFHTPLGHVGNPAQLVSQKSAGFRALLLRGAEWAATGKVTIALPDELKAQS